MAKKTQVEQIREIINVTVARHTVTGCNFIGVQYDAKAVEAITLIAKGVLSNNEVLLKLANVLNASNVTIDAMIKVEN